MIDRTPRPVYRQRRAGRRWTAALLGLLVGLPGCTTQDHRLNSPNVSLERRVGNHTRAALFARLVPGGGESPVRTRPEIFPASAPASVDPMESNIAAVKAPPPDVEVVRDGCFVGLALSGGGSRSANFSAACMFQLQRAGLLQKVDYLSTVSGGSLTGAYYCLYADPTEDAPCGRWNPGEVQRRLTHSFATDLIARTVLLPWNWVALTVTDYDRTDILAGSFEERLFTRNGRKLTYADLRPDRPRLLINATDLQSGRRFIFCNESFDELNSDLSKYPIAHAVAASSAVPVVLHPVTLRDYSTIFPQYRHLIDGGVADNLGVSTLVETFTAQVESAAAAGRPDPYPNGAIFVVVDSHTQFDVELSERGDVGLIESLKTAAGLSTTALLNRASSATLADIIVHNSPDDATAKSLRAAIDTLNRNGYLSIKDRTGHRVRVLYLSLSQVNRLPHLPFQSFGQSVNSIDTYFNIEPTQAYHLYQAADLLVREKFDARLIEMAGELEGREAPAAAPPSDR